MVRSILRGVPIQLFTGLWNGDPARLPLTEGVMLAWVRPSSPAAPCSDLERAPGQSLVAEGPGPVPHVTTPRRRRS